jgi:hypothetical protein
MREHRSVIEKAKLKVQSQGKEISSDRTTARLFGSGGIYEKLQHDEFRRGLHLLETNSFKSAAAKAEWLNFRKNLPAEMLSAFKDQTWQ